LLYHSIARLIGSIIKARLDGLMAGNLSPVTVVSDGSYTIFPMTEQTSEKVAELKEIQDQWLARNIRATGNTEE